jgi:outer membrane receptor protein involved in Fe transport
LGEIRTTKIVAGYKNNVSDNWVVDGRLSYYNSFRKSTFDLFFPDSYEYQDYPSKGWDADLTINSDLTKQLHLTIGGKYRSILNVENNLHLPTNGFGFFYNTTQTIDDDENINSWAGFAQLEYKPFEKLRIIAGGRAEQRFEFTLKTIVADTLFGVPALISREKYNQDELQFIPRLAAIYSINNNNIIKFLYGKAINTPSWFQVMNGGVQRLNLHSQNIESYELNYIATPFPKLLINTSLFYNKMNDLIVRTLGVNEKGEFYNYNSNAGKVETKGMELTLQLKPNDKFYAEASCTYQKSIDLDNKNITYNYSPNLLGNIKISYRFNANLNASIITNYVDKMETNWLSNPDGTGTRIGKPVAAYYTLGANMRLENLVKEGLFFEIHGSNLLNKDVMYPATTNNNGIFPKGTVGMGRQIVCSLGYKFK